MNTQSDVVISNSASPFGLSKRQRIWAILALVLAGESIFFLPFVIPRVFRSTVLEVFEISNTELGYFFSIYGLVAIPSYLFGGPLADRFAPSKLMAFALCLTACGGLLLYFNLDSAILPFLYGFWGISTILFSWAALLRTTRVLAGKDYQGLGFGFLEGGRGLISVLVSHTAAYIFSLVAGAEIDKLLSDDRIEAFENVILFFSLFVFLVALVVLKALKPVDRANYHGQQNIDFKKVSSLLSYPAIWLQALIIICAYSGYKVSDDFSLIAKDFLNYSESEAAFFTTLTFWIRPISAIAFGFFGDKLSSSKVILFCFLGIMVAALNMGIGFFENFIYIHVLFTICTTATLVYALRGLYFSIMNEANIPIAVTGTAVGIASIVGYLPDIFMGPIMGYFLDSSPGKLGHELLFLFMSCLAILGLIFTLEFIRLNNKRLIQRNIEN